MYSFKFDWLQNFYKFKLAYQEKQWTVTRIFNGIHIKISCIFITFYTNIVYAAGTSFPSFRADHVLIYNKLVVTCNQSKFKVIVIYSSYSKSQVFDNYTHSNSLDIHAIF